MASPEFWADVTGDVEKFAERHPDRVEAAEIVAAITAESDIGDHDDLSAHLRFTLPADFADYWARESEFAPLRAAVRGWPVQMGDTPFDFRQALRGLGIPTMIINGEADLVSDPRWARMLHDAVPGSQLRILADAGHMPHIEQEREFTTAVAEFLSAAG